VGFNKTKERLVIEKIPAMAIMHSRVEMFDDLELLGVYVFVSYLLDKNKNDMPVDYVSHEVRKRFKLSETDSLRLVNCISSMKIFDKHRDDI
jgi:hypothetical protein